MRTGWSAVAVASLALVAYAGSAAAGNKPPPENWDGLTEVKAKSMDVGYVMPGADFSQYRRVMLDKTMVAFRKDWMRNMNDTSNLSRRITDEDAAKIMETAQKAFEEAFQKAFTEAGYEVVNIAAPDVLRVSTAVVNLYINAPDTMSAGRSRTYTTNAGEATLVLEVRDGPTNALLGRVIDRRETLGLSGLSNRVTNTADFQQLFGQWAKICAKGLDHLKAISPIPANLKPKQKLQ